MAGNAARPLVDCNDTRTVNQFLPLFFLHCAMLPDCAEEAVPVPESGRRGTLPVRQCSRIRATVVPSFTSIAAASKPGGPNWPTASRLKP